MDEIIKSKNSIESCSDETITRLDGGNYTLVKNNDTKYEYNTKYKNNNSLISKREFNGKLSIDTNESLDIDKLHKIFGIDNSKTPDSYDMKVPYYTPCRRHKKKRINKKLMKRYGRSNFILRKVILKDCKIKENPDGTFEFTKDGEL